MFGVFTFTLTHFLAKIFFPKGMGVYKIVVEIPEGWGGYFSGQKMEIPGRGWGLREIPSVVGVWIFSGTTQYRKVIVLLLVLKICPHKLISSLWGC